MAHIVTCIYCRNRFDRDKQPCVQVSNRRYAHTECSISEEQKKAKEELDKEALNAYIIKLFKIDYVDARIQKQIKQYVEEYKFTYSGIHKALTYFLKLKVIQQRKQMAVQVLFLMYIKTHTTIILLYGKLNRRMRIKL